MKKILSFFAALSLATAGSSFGDGFRADQTRFFSNTIQCVDVEFSRFGTYLALADRTEGNSVRVYDAGGELLWRFRQPLYWAGMYKKAGFLRFSPDESFLVFPSFRTDRDIALVNPRNGELIADLTGHSATVAQVALSPDGKILVSSSYGEVFLWRDEGKGFHLIDRLPEGTPTVTSISFDSSGELIAVAMNGNSVRKIEVFRVDSGRFKSIFSTSREENNLSREYERVVFSPDGKWLASNYGENVETWLRSGGSYSSGPTLEKIDLGSVFSLGFSPDSSFLLTGHFRHIRAWRFVDGFWKEDATITPHHGGVMDLAFSSDGKKLAIAGIADQNGFGLWSVASVGPSSEGRVLALLHGALSPAQKKHLDSSLATKLLSSLDPKDVAPRDMFETDEEFQGRELRAGRKVAALFQEEMERSYKAVRIDKAGTLYEVMVPLETQGTYAIESKTYSFRFMEIDAAVILERDAARDLYRSWEKARVQAARIETSEGPTYTDFLLLHPGNGKTYPLGLSQNPFTGEKLDRYGVRVPSISVGPDLLLRNLSLDGIFPSLYRYYGENPLGRVTFQNSGSTTISKLKASFFISSLMNTPTRLETPDILGVGGKTDVAIRALIDTTVLNQAEGSSVAAELTVEYESGGKTYHETVVRPVGLLNRNAIRWDDDGKVVVFMTMNDPTLVRYSGRTAGLQDLLPTDLMTGEFLSALWFFGALKESGVRYVVDPSSSYEIFSRDKGAVDYVRFPMETLDAKAGDCDDLAVLYNALLESVGVHTAYITTPGHIFTAFGLGLDEKNALLAFGKAEDFIVKDGKVWLPVETTQFGEGFIKAWQTGAREWRTATAEGSAGFFETETAWKKYPPGGFSSKASVPTLPEGRLKALFSQELDKWREIALKPREKELLDLLAKALSPARENRLGILYARFGLFDKALERFDKAGKNYVPALINSGIVLRQKREYLKSKEVFLQALEGDAKNTAAIAGLAEVYFDLGDKTEAESLLGKLRSLDPIQSAVTRPSSSVPRASGMGKTAFNWQDDGTN